MLPILATSYTLAAALVSIKMIIEHYLSYFAAAHLTYGMRIILAEPLRTIIINFQTQRARHNITLLKSSSHVYRYLGDKQQPQHRNYPRSNETWCHYQYIAWSRNTISILAVIILLIAGSQYFLMRHTSWCACHHCYAEALLRRRRLICCIISSMQIYRHGHTAPA